MTDCLPAWDRGETDVDNKYLTCRGDVNAAVASRRGRLRQWGLIKRRPRS